MRNARAAGEVTLSRGRHQHRFKITEAAPGDSATVLREYARLVPVTRPYFSARPQDPASLFAAEAAAHPVFRLIEDGNPGQPPVRPHPGLG